MMKNRMVTFCLANETETPEAVRDSAVQKQKTYPQNTGKILGKTGKKHKKSGFC